MKAEEMGGEREGDVWITLMFALCFMMGNAQRKATFPECKGMR